MSRVSSQLRVFVRFKEDTVFAGEEIECSITFKNVEFTSRRPHEPTSHKGNNNNNLRPLNPLDRLQAARNSLQLSSSRRTSAISQSQSPTPLRSTFSHKSTSSFSVVESANKQQTPELPGGGFHIANAGPDHRHDRKVSIVSLGSPTVQQRPSAKHGRSASMQVSGDKSGGRQRPSLSGHRAYTMNPPRSTSSPSASPLSPHSKPGLSPSQPQPAHSPWGDGAQSQLRKPSRDRLLERGNLANDTTFKFPPQPNHSRKPSNPPLSIKTQSDRTDVLPSRRRSPNSAFPSNISDISQGDHDRPGSLTKVFSVRSMDGSPRSSMDLYSISNRSDETLASELPTQARRLLGTPSLSRASSVASRGTPAKTESILMGYAQVSGVFMLDGSLVNQGPFEDVKRKAVVGGQGGGGVVGVTRANTDTGLFGSLSWNSIGESLNGLIGGSGPSSMKEMKGIADSNAVPLLSTSKSILFVDLNLAPGESRTYSYSFVLPRGLPPSHKGRAMKVSYNIVIGTHRQGPRNGQQQSIRQVEVPFRVLTGVNQHGEYLGHDLMSPYIILKDRARISSIADPPTEPFQSKQQSTPSKPIHSSSSAASSSANDFQTYVDTLLTKQARGSSQTLLSPTAELPTGQNTHTPQSPHLESSIDTQMLSTSDVIDAAIRHCSNKRSPIHSPTNFTIARSSVPIASLTISRPALKIGDTITCMIDFSRAKLPCYAFEATIESSERVDPALAIRSAQSVERATRRVWASHVENAIWARRCVFKAQIPIDATPAFTTTGVSLDWCVRLELVVSAATAATTPNESTSRQETFGRSRAERILELANVDDRGATLVARQYLRCESFEVEIPIRVYGTAGGNVEEEGGDIEGLAI